MMFSSNKFEQIHEDLWVHLPSLRNVFFRPVGVGFSSFSRLLSFMIFLLPCLEEEHKPAQHPGAPNARNSHGYACRLVYRNNHADCFQASSWLR